MPQQMRVAIGLPSKTDDWHFILAKQMGCEEVVLATPADLPGEEFQQGHAAHRPDSR